MDLRVLYSCVLCLLFLSIGEAQEASIRFDRFEGIQISSINAQHTSTHSYSANLSTFREILKGRNISTELAFGNDIQLNVDLSPSYILADKSILSIINTEGQQIVEQFDQAITLRGFSSYGPLRLTINDHFIGGFVTTAHGKQYIEQIRTENELTYFNLVDEHSYQNIASRSCAHHEQIEAEINKEIAQRVTNQCYEIDLAIAADHSMFEKHGSAINVSNHIVNIMNMVAGNYELNGSANFDDGISFNIVQIMVSSCGQCDEWTSSTDIFEVLSSFANWSIDGGFSAGHHMGQFWTDRDYSGNYVGLADAGTTLFCGNGAYHVLQDYTTSTAFLSTMAAHEIGHNFGGTHMSSTGFIMSSTLNNTDTWSTSSQQTIGATIASQGASCLSSCIGDSCADVTNLEVSNITTTGFQVSWDVDAGASFKVHLTDLYTDQIIYDVTINASSVTITPSDYDICKRYLIEVYKDCGSENGDISSIIFHSPMGQGCADFKSDVNVNWSDETVSFTDLSVNATTWNWDFGDGNTSSIQNPTHTYTSPGAYMVKLMVNNGAHVMEQDSLISVLPDRSVPYELSDGGSFDVNLGDFATEGLNGTSSIWELGMATGPLSSTDKVWKTKLSEDIGKIYSESALYTPRFDFTITSDYLLEFEQSMEAQFCNGPFALRVEYTINNGASWTRLGSHGDNDASINSWYNRGPDASCPISVSVFDDQTGWTFNASNVYSSYDVSFLSGNDQVGFRYLFEVDGSFTGGYEADGSMINNFRISTSGVVALDILNFDGSPRDGYNQIDWAVANMENFEAFNVQKSPDGIHFQDIGRIPADLQTLSYRFKDENLSQAVNYYRLRLVDTDGSYDYSEIIKIHNTVLDYETRIFPNPIMQDRFLSINTEIAYDQLNLISTTGKTVLQSSAVNGITLSDIPAGVYILALSQNQEIVYKQKLVIL